MQKAKVIVDKDYVISKTDENLFNSFVEPLGRCIYGGIYEPGHKRADENGFREDVLEYTKPLNVTANRFPGGNYISTYRWEDTIGPKEDRPRRAEVAWQCIETNEFGLNEFVDWSKKNGSDVMMTVNLATRGVLEAMDCVEYCNVEKGTYWSDLRRAHGYEKPHNFKYWCLSNEVDGVWQVGQADGRAYGVLARETAKAMKLLDKDIKTVLVGASSPGMENFPTFAYEALDAAYEFVDYVSLHQYFNNSYNDTPSYLAKSLTTEEYFKQAASMFNFVKAKHRSDHDVYISFDEYNTWHTITKRPEERFEIPQWSIAPPLIEDTYNTEDAVMMGAVFIAVLRNSDIVKIACVSELCNCISHIRTSNGGGCWVLPPYYTWLHYQKYGRGTVLRTTIDSPTYDCADYKNVPFVDSAVVLNEDGYLTVFAINRSLEESAPLELTLRGFSDYEIDEHIVVCDDDPKATNTEENPDRVLPKNVETSAFKDGVLSATLEKLSWNVIRLKPVGA